MTTPTPTPSPSSSGPGFGDLGLSEPQLAVLTSLGYSQPSPIQAATIPAILAGRDVVGQAQTGTGKTAAFALPLLVRIDPMRARPQVLVLVPTRELALQVAEAFRRYGSWIPGLRVLPIYGGQAYGRQIGPLKRGVHVVVGTPGRVIDLLGTGDLAFDMCHAVVLDEADEMLKMGFVDDVEMILAQVAADRQTVLFSATLSDAVGQIVSRHTKSALRVTFKREGATAAGIRQRWLEVPAQRKLDALVRLLDTEPFEAALVFVQTKTGTVEVAEKLLEWGHVAVALSGDVPQQERERIVERLRAGAIRVVVATDVAARGLDVDRISHVFNLDFPKDSESYVHRIGRTGRAGREGDAILFVTPSEKRKIRFIERVVGRPLEIMALPSSTVVNTRRRAHFKARMAAALDAPGIEDYGSIIDEIVEETGLSARDVAAAFARLAQGERPLLVPELPSTPFAAPRPRKAPTGDRRDRERDRDSGPGGMQLVPYRIEVGRRHGVMPGQIVGAIANETGLSSSFIGHITISDDFSVVDLPVNLPTELLQILDKVRVKEVPLRTRRLMDDGGTDVAPPRRARKAPGGPKGPPRRRS